MLEGALTHLRIRQLFINDVSLRSRSSLIGLYKYFEIQDRYLRSHAKGGGNAKNKISAYW